jgi:hypothetical protein
MYENEIAAAATGLSTRGGNKKGPVKADRTYTARCEELLQKLGDLGFGSWTSVPVGKRPEDPEAQLDGVELSSGDVVSLRLHNNHGKLVPKHVSFSLVRVRNQRGVIVGVHVGTFRFTDLRTKQSYYDGALWGLGHFRAQLAVEQYREQLTIAPEVVESHLARAAAKLVEMGITNTRHVILPRAGDCSVRDINMIPYLVGDYGAMPVAIRLMYTKATSLTMQFYIIGPIGLVNLDFGFLDLNSNGDVDDSMMDIGKLLAGPTKK